jgi:hypothetical protein
VLHAGAPQNGSIVASQYPINSKPSGGHLLPGSGYLELQ